MSGSSEPTLNLGPTYGAMLVGVLFAAFFQGLLTVQAFNYFDNFPDDKFKNKALVVTVVILDTIHLVFISIATYDSLVTNWGVVSHLTIIPIELNLHLIFTALSVIVSQAFFLERIWKFSKRNIWITATLTIFAIVPLAIIIHITVPLVRNTSAAEYNKHIKETIAILVMSALGRRRAAFNRKETLSAFISEGFNLIDQVALRTISVISRAVYYVVATGIATSMIAVASLIAFLGGHDTTFYFIAIHFQLGRTYTNALLATLNSRKNMRQMLSGSQGFKSTGTELQLDVSTSRSKDNSHVEDGETIVCVGQKLRTSTDCVNPSSVQFRSNP
ncbi:hypothetical protein BJ165DRAFT_1405681 [Panaeolus papilionaceus]|nr:hypothetical protein BJ165DRAFT_1405681 [Panaeolus papilionaceus]